MVYRHLHKKLELGPVECISGKNGYFELEYYLIENDCPSYDKVYGLEILKKDHSNISENERIENLFLCKEKASKIIESLARNTVTPVTLTSILDDIIGT